MWQLPISICHSICAACLACDFAAHAGEPADTMVAVVDFAIGTSMTDPDYQFAEVRDLVLLPDHRFVVVDYQERRVAVFDREGRFVTDIGGPGEGPGEFAGRPVSASVGPNGEVWVEFRATYQVYTPDSQNWSYSRTVRLGPKRPDQRYLKGKPMFAPDGSIAIWAKGGSRGTLVWIVGGEIVREDTLPPAIPSDEMGYGVASLGMGNDGRPIQEVLRGPYHPRDLEALGRTGGYAMAVTSRYAIRLFGDDGVHFLTIRRQHPGPRVSSAERRRAEHVVDSLVAVYRQHGGTYPAFVVPQRKPPIRDLWYDEDNRLWVQLSRPDTDSLARAHVYSDRGRFLFAAAWPREVSLSHGAIRGAVAVGRRIGALDVPEVVRMTFAPRD